MFKKTFALGHFQMVIAGFSSGAPLPAVNSFYERARQFQSIVLRAICMAMLMLLMACRTTGPGPQMNLSEPGWTTRTGQAVWRPNAKAPEIAGDIVLATNPDGRAFVQFSKGPLTVAVATKTAGAWHAEFPMQNKRFSAPGKPPARLVWLVLPAAVLKGQAAKPWTWQSVADDHWRLENPRTGETLEGFFSPGAVAAALP